MTAIYAGSFDPVTLGHMDIICRAARITDHLIIAVLINPQKCALFSLDERVLLLREAVNCIQNVTIDSFSGLLADYAKQNGADMLVRGIRNAADLDYEVTMARYNRVLTGGTDTLFIPADAELAHISGSAVREIASFIYLSGRDDAVLDTMVSIKAKEALMNKYLIKY